jgi:hypothetical protein
MAHTKKAENLINNYLTQKVIDNVNEVKSSRSDVMRRAGYSEVMIEKKNPELTQLYADITTSVINKVGFTLNEYINDVVSDIENNKHKDQDIGNKIKQLASLVTIYKGLAPTFKSRTTTKDTEGNLKTVWTQLN